MKTLGEQSTPSPAVQSEKLPDGFHPPGVTDLNGLTDGRSEGSYSSSYSGRAWLQILCELFYLITLLGASLAGLFVIARYVVLGDAAGSILSPVFGPVEGSVSLQLYSTIALSGVCGGCTSALKWLYHSVAKQRWHRDRVIWRLVVPPLSGTISVFAGMMILSGLVPFLAKSWLANLTAGAAFGFFVGLFSDNLLASLEKVAFNLFGTMNDRFQKKSDEANTTEK